MSNDVANQNISFTDLIKNPDKELAESMLAKCLIDLETTYGLQPSILAEVLFQFTLTQMEPPVELTAQSGTAWAMQLTRFKDELNSRVDELNALYDITDDHD